jgi:hypothetical protein
VRARNPIQKTACTFRNRQYPQNTPVSDTGDSHVHGCEDRVLARRPYDSEYLALEIYLHVGSEKRLRILYLYNRRGRERDEGRHPVQKQDDSRLAEP